MWNAALRWEEPSPHSENVWTLRASRSQTDRMDLNLCCRPGTVAHVFTQLVYLSLLILLLFNLSINIISGVGSQQKEIEI